MTKEEWYSQLFEHLGDSAATSKADIGGMEEKADCEYPF